MGIKVLAQPINFKREQIESSFMQIDEKSTYVADRIVYYPYYLFVYNVKAKRVFLPMNEKIGCTVDALGGKGSLADSYPKLEEINIEKKEMLERSWSLQECLSISESFVFRSLSLKMRMISFSEVQVEKKKLFYRPYWLVFNSNYKEGEHFIVDGVSGQYHPL